MHKLGFGHLRKEESFLSPWDQQGELRLLSLPLSPWSCSPWIKWCEPLPSLNSKKFRQNMTHWYMWCLEEVEKCLWLKKLGPIAEKPWPLHSQPCTNLMSLLYTFSSFSIISGAFNCTAVTIIYSGYEIQPNNLFCG